MILLSIQELWQLVVRLWNTGNRWARWILRIIIFWPIATVIVAINYGSPVATAIVGLVPVVLALLYFMTIGWSLLLAIIGQRARAWIASIIFYELVVVMFAAIFSPWLPFHPGMVAIVAVPIVLLSIDGTGPAAKKFFKAVSYLVIIGVVWAIIFPSSFKWAWNKIRPGHEEEIAASSIPTATPSYKVWSCELKGLDQLSKPFFTKAFPAGKTDVKGPDGTQAHIYSANGVEHDRVEIHQQNWPVHSGDVIRFSGPVGGRVTIKSLS